MPGTIPNQGYPPLRDGFTKKDRTKAMYEYEHEKRHISVVDKVMGIALAVCIIIYVVIMFGGMV